MYSVLGMFDLEFGCANYRAIEGGIGADAFYEILINDVVRGLASPHATARDRTRPSLG